MYAQLTEWVSQGIPTFFYTDFKGETLRCYPVDELHNHDIEFSFSPSRNPLNCPHTPESDPIAFSRYREKFDSVQEHIKNGNTYLLNLTQPTPIKTHYSLREIYTMSHAPYKLRVGSSFVCFSPEPFITIKDSKIHTYPMKGTIDADLPNAIDTIMNDSKELAEHTMIVDLLRNDLGIVATEIRVEEFRYITTIETGSKRLHHVSSHISGTLHQEWQHNIGSILHALLPAGSISGTPKKKTVEIIESIEGYERGFFTGVFGYFDGKDLYSAVAIRFIEQTPHGLIYKSGGGITTESKAHNEYEEMIHKIYIP
ncbi:MAG TPA: aminodeoxychorismate synthase component I [Sulfuricurvum sp.]|nr:aminodeoxychorismate synthase component I [Sulfuricurvum sp.]